MMLSETERKRESAEERSTTVSQRLWMRWKLLQVIGAVLIALSIFIEWPIPVDTSLPQTSSFLLVLGVLVLLAGLIVGKCNARNS